MSNRKITNQQFSDGTTVDGDRLDEGLQDLEQKLNAVPEGDLASRYLQTQIVAGWTAYQAVSQKHQAPWLRYQNTASDRQGSTGDIVNPFRLKGTETSTFAAWAAPNDPTKWIWTTTIYCEDPCIVDALDMMWQRWTGAATPGNVDPQLDFTSLGSGYLSQGLQCTISVDDPNNTESPLRNSVVTQLRHSYMGAATLSTDPAIFLASSEDMLPAAPVPHMPSAPGTMPGNQLWFQRRNMQVHIPANSRVSFAVALDGLGVTTRLNYDSYMRGSPNLVITLLEPIRK